MSDEEDVPRRLRFSVVRLQGGVVRRLLLSQRGRLSPKKKITINLVKVNPENYFDNNSRCNGLDSQRDEVVCCFIISYAIYWETWVLQGKYRSIMII